MTPSEADEGFTQPRRLHPMSILLGIPFLQLVQALIVPAAALLATAGRVTIWIALLLVVGGSVARLLAWQRFRFSFDGEVVRVSSGVISRSHRSVHVDRIQQVDLQRPLLQRLTGTASVRVQTAGGSSEPEIELRILSYEDAVAFRRAVGASKTPDTRQGTGAELVLSVPLRHVALASVTGVQLLVFPALLGGALQLLGGHATRIIELTVEWLAAQPGFADLATQRRAAVALTLAGVALVALLVALVVGVVRDGNFRIERADGELVVRRGLLGTRDSTVPVRRVQLVQIHRNPVRRLLGYSVISIHSAGGGIGGDTRVVVPLLPDRDVARFLARVFDGFDELPGLLRHPVQARRRALWRRLRPAMLLVVGGWIAVSITRMPPEPVMLAMSGLVLAAAVGLAAAEYRHLGHATTDRLVASRHGAATLTLNLAPLHKIQAVSVRSSWFQRRLGLGTLIAHVAGPGGDVQIRDVSATDARPLRDELVVHASRPVRPPAGS